MKIVNKRKVHSLPLLPSSVSELYPSDDINNVNSYAHNLYEIIDVVKDNLEIFNTNFTCLIDDRAFEAFKAFANDVYMRTRNEACGVLTGYYFHDPNNEEKKIILATNFLEAHGPATRVTCEISFDDNIRFGNFCDENKMLPIIWVHSHPGFGTFYSGTDSDTLARSFRANHQMGIVVDNLQNQVMGFKIKNGKEENESVYSFNLTDSKELGKLVYQCQYKVNRIIEKSSGVISMKKDDTTNVHEETPNEDKNRTEQPKKKRNAIEKKEKVIIMNGSKGLHVISMKFILSKINHILNNCFFRCIVKTMKFLFRHRTDILLLLIFVEFLLILIKLWM